MNKGSKGRRGYELPKDRISFFNVKTKRKVQIPSSQVQIVKIKTKRGPMLFYKAKDPKTADELYRIKGRAGKNKSTSSSNR